MIPLLLSLKDITIQILLGFFKLLKKFPWLILVIIPLIYIIYLHIQISGYKNTIDNISNALSDSTNRIQNVYQTYAVVIDDANKLNKILISDNDSLSKELNKVIKKNKEIVSQIIDIKFKERTYSTDTLEQGNIEKTDLGYRISFNKVFSDLTVSGYVLYPQALYDLNVVYKPKNFKIVETKTEYGLIKVYAFPSEDSGIESVSIHTLPVVYNNSFWRKFDPDLDISIKSYGVFGADFGVRYWKIKPMVGADIWNGNKSYLFFGISVKLF